jgi:two-component system response regulator
MTRNHVILLVEDNPDDVELALRAFEKCNVANKIIVARDGAEALEHFFPTADRQAQHREPMPQVVLLDLKLPKVDGLEVLRRLRSDDRTRRIPVVMLTSSNEEQDVVRSYDLGANSFVRKPVDFGEFVKAAQQLGFYWLVLNEPSPEGPTRPHAKEQPAQRKQTRAAEAAFLANMSHELRTPLNSIIGFAELMHKGTVGPMSPEHREYLGDILNSAKHLLQLINEALDVANVESATSPGPITHNEQHGG